MRGAGALSGQSREHRYGLSSILCKSIRAEDVVSKLIGREAGRAMQRNALIKMFPAFRIRLPLRKYLPDLAFGAHDNDRYRRMAEAVPTK